MSDSARPLRPRAMAATGLVVATMLLSGCGGESPERLARDDYRQRILDIARGDDSLEAQRLFTESVAADLGRAECAARVTRLHRDLESILDDVAAIAHPPLDAEDAQRDFLAAARISVRRVGEIAAEVEAGRLPCGQPLNRQLYGMASTERAQQAIARLEARGYLVFGN